MTTDCFTDLDLAARDGAHIRSLTDKIVEYGAAAITAIGFVLLLPTAALIMSLIQH